MFTPLESKRESLGAFIICGHMFYNAFGHVVTPCSSSNSFISQCVSNDRVF